MSDLHDSGVATAGQPRNRAANHVVVEIAIAGRRLNLWPYRLAPLVGGVVALVLAAAAETQIRQSGTTALNIALYVSAAILFALSAIGLPPRASDRPADIAQAIPSRRARIVAWAVPIAAILIALGLALACFEALRKDIKAPSAPGLWLGAMAVLIGAAALSGRPQAWPARWGVETLPGSYAARALMRYALLILFLITVAARVLWLDRLPIGINPDEGDRAGRMAVNIVRGSNTQGLFESGWYYISMVYFTLLAGFMKIVGLGFAQARLFHALCGIATAGLVTVIGLRNFGWRIGLLAGALLSLMGIALQFSRVTTEATVTALCWTASLACFYEAARSGKLWAWAAAGILGGLSIYFYPSGRMWALFAVGWCLYLLIRGPHRGRVALGVALAAVGSLVAVAPYFGNIWNKMVELTLRFDQTSALNLENARRLIYYNPQWSMPQLILEQLRRSIFVFDAYPDGGGLWPHLKPITQPVLALPILLGLGWGLFRWRDPRAVALTMWFWAGVVGMITTVETPNVQRMGTAIPALALIAALVIDSVARRVELAGQALTSSDAPAMRPRPWVKGLATLGVFVFAGLVMLAEGRFYFVDYAKMDLWRPWNAEADATRAEGPSTQVATLSRSFHMITSGWVQLLALDTPKGGIKAPGASLPLTQEPDKNLTFIVYPQESQYLPYLRDIYPLGSSSRVTDTSQPQTDRLLFTLYRVPMQALQASHGALVTPAGGAPQRVETLGAAPRGWKRIPSAMTWTAGLRVEQYWNYTFKLGAGPARLRIDGREILAAVEGQDGATATVSLARGDHFVELEGVIVDASKLPLLEWARVVDLAQPARTEPIPARLLDAAMSAPRGLFSTVIFGDTPAGRQLRIDNALATCCFSDQMRAQGRPYVAHWQGSLIAPRSGVFEISLLSEGAATLMIGERVVLDVPANGDVRTVSVALSAGAQPIDLVYRSPQGGGTLELAWTPPQGERSIIPPSALRPPPGVGVDAPVKPEQLGGQPVDAPIDLSP